jgi:FkbH-like protein
MSNSELYQFHPDVAVVFISTHKLLQKFNKSHGKKSFADNTINLVKVLYNTVKSNLNSKTIFCNFPEIDDSVFGCLGNSHQESFLFQTRKLNYFLGELACRQHDFFIADLATVQNVIGRKVVFDPSIYVNTEMVVSLDALPYFAKKVVDVIGAINGNINKCLILDLDNTIWGGVIGDDGLENIQLGQLGIGKAFVEFQHWLKKLKDRGVILAVCSKNTESIAKEPFEKHPDMVISLDDVAVFVANWENKAENIRTIKNILNIGFDSMVFLDDSPFERNLVRDNISGITVPELPEDPADYLEYLYSLNLFETVTYSSEDSDRTKHYQIEAKRVAQKQNFINEDEFLQSLNMVSVVTGFTSFNIPRVSQLSQRSNQFNLRTVRYTEEDVFQVASSQDYVDFAFTLTDKFGDNGLIGVIIMRKESPEFLFIESWFMSCRVLKRGMENFMLNTIVDYARTNNFSLLKGEYLPTKKNVIVKDHFKNLGFENEDSNTWMLDVNNYSNRICHIVRKDN